MPQLFPIAAITDEFSPDLPTAEQLAEADAAVADLRELPDVIGALAGSGGR